MSIFDDFDDHFPLKGFKIVVDASNGAAYKIAPQILLDLGADVIPIACSPNGKNINLDCGSTHPETLRKTVVATEANLGIALDGDADRILIVDENGRILDGDQILYILAKSNISNAGLPKLNFKLAGETIYNGRDAYLLKLNKKGNNAHFKGYMLIDKATGFALIFRSTWKIGNETIPAIYASSFESDENVRSKIQRIDVEKTDYKVSKKILETRKKNEPKVYMSDEERAKRINDFVCKEAAKELPIMTPNTTNIP